MAPRPHVHFSRPRVKQELPGAVSRHPRTCGYVGMNTLAPQNTQRHAFSDKQVPLQTALYVRVSKPSCSNKLRIDHNSRGHRRKSCNLIGPIPPYPLRATPGVEYAGGKAPRTGPHGLQFDSDVFRAPGMTVIRPFPASTSPAITSRPSHALSSFPEVSTRSTLSLNPPTSERLCWNRGFDEGNGV